MFTFTIVLSILAILCSIIGIANGVANNKVDTTGVYTLLLVFNIFLLVANVIKHNNPEHVTSHVVRNVEEYQVDSTLVINGVDTTKTYTITYWN